MEKLKVAVIGCGSIAIHRHVPEYASLSNVEIVAFCDPVAERAEEMVSKYGGRVYADYREMLEREKPDAVSVCTPNTLHAEVSIAAANAGAHVLCEKPIATSEPETLEMIEAARRNGVYLMVGHNQRLMAPHVKAKEILQEGKLGKVVTFRTAFGHPGPEQWSIEGKEGWFFRKSKAFVGAMGDLGVHKADLIRWMLDDEVAEVAAFVDTLDKKDTDVDDNAVCLFRMNSGAIGTMAASWTYYGSEDNSTVLYCEKGVIKIGTDPVDQVIVQTTDGNIEKFNVGAIATNDEGGQVKSGIIDEFVNGILTSTPPSITGEEGLKSLKVILAALKSSETKTFVKPQA
jgi:UDP-N-acetylglucosamine 3-dehydrogenase